MTFKLFKVLYTSIQFLSVINNLLIFYRYNITSGELNDGGFDPKINSTLNAEKDDALVVSKFDCFT